MYSYASAMRRRATIDYMRKVRIQFKDNIKDKIKHKGLNKNHIQCLINLYAGFTVNPHILEELIISGVISINDIKRLRGNSNENN